MKITFNISRKIVVNGKEYGSVEEMPEKARRVFEQAQGKGGLQVDAGVKVSVNNQTLKSVEELPPELRKLYDHAMAGQAPEKKRAAGQIVLPPEWNAQPALTPKRAYRRIQGAVVAGALVLGAVVACGAILQKQGNSALAAKLTWALLAPVPFIAYAVYVSIRHWRCPHCGAGLPGHARGVRPRRCLKCGAPYEL
jgi:hypothetical protein